MLPFWKHILVLSVRLSDTGQRGHVPHTCRSQRAGCVNWAQQVPLPVTVLPALADVVLRAASELITRSCVMSARYVAVRTCQLGQLLPAFMPSYAGCPHMASGCSFMLLLPVPG